MQVGYLRVTGMHCDHCVSNVTNALRRLAGVSEARVSLAAGDAIVRYDEQLTSSEQVKAAVRDAGYGVDGVEPAHSHRGGGACGGNGNAAPEGSPPAHRHHGAGGCCG